MPAPCAPRIDAQDVVRLRIPVPATAPALDTVVSEVRTRALGEPQTRFCLDCTGITEMTGEMMADLASVRSELRETGSDLVLISCGETLRRALIARAYASLLGEVPARHAAHPMRGPHPSFFRTHRADA
jgi:hypothetical protein